MTNVLLEEPETGRKKPEPVQLRTPHDFGLVTQALIVRKDELDKLAKKTLEGGYPRESRAIAADAMAIEHHVMPAFRDQRELPLVSHDQLEKAIAAALKVPVYRAFEGMGDPKVAITFDGVQARKESLLERLALRMTLYVKDVADEAYNQGVAARENTSEALAYRAIETLRAE